MHAERSRRALTNVVPAGPARFDFEAPPMKPVVLAPRSVLPGSLPVRHRGPRKPVEDTAPKSLWIMAERFEKEGQSSAREVTLKQLVEQYPGLGAMRAKRGAPRDGGPAWTRASAKPAAESVAKTESKDSTAAADAPEGGTTPAPEEE